MGTGTAGGETWNRMCGDRRPRGGGEGQVVRAEEVHVETTTEGDLRRTPGRDCVPVREGDGHRRYLRVSATP